MKKIIFAVFIVLEILIWPIGIWMMMTGYGGHSPDVIGNAMATMILVFALPIFIVSN